VDKIAESIQRFFKSLQKDRAGIHLEKLNGKRAIDPLHLDWRMPGWVTAMAQDGDFLWVGTGMYSGDRLLLVHKPSLSLVGWCSLDGGVTSLSVGGRDIWVGAAYGKQLLTRIEKTPMLTIPRSQWLSLTLSAYDRAHLVGGMSTRDQAMYAFYAGDDARVAALLWNVNPETATLEEMFLLAFAHDASALDQPEIARAWSDRIAARYPETPWAKAAREFLAASDETHKAIQRQAKLLAKYDRNHDGVLDPSERSAMERDPGYQREEKALREEQLDTQLQAIFKKYDRNGDGRLDRNELEALRRDVILYSGAPPEMLSGRKIPVAPLLTKAFPAADALLKKYDTRHQGGLELAGLKALAKDLQARR